MTIILRLRYAKIMATHANPSVMKSSEDWENNHSNSVWIKFEE